MASSRSTNTMVELFMDILKKIAEAKAAPDADLQKLIGLETEILQYLRDPVESNLTPQLQSLGAGMGAGTLSMSGVAGPGMTPGPPPGAAGMGARAMGPPGMAGGGGMGGGMGMTNPDELRRILQAA